MVVESILLLPVKAILDAVAKKLAGGAVDALKRRPIPDQDALRLALGLAVRKYCTNLNSQVVAKPLLGRKSILRNDAVAAEFANALVGTAPPNAELIGQHWRDRLSDPPDSFDFTKEAQTLIGYFDSQRLWVEEVRDIQNVKTLERMSADIESFAEQADSIENQLANLLRMLDEGFGFPPGRGVQHLRFDQTGYIEEHTRSFVGRAAVIGRINQAMGSPCRSGGVVFLLAPPGVGKTAVLASLVRRENYVHHFNRRLAGGPTTIRHLLANICAQLVAKYDLGPEARDSVSNATHYPEVLEMLLRDIDRSGSARPVVVVDALDEMDQGGRETAFIHALAPLCTFVVSTRPDLFDLLPNVLRGTSLNQYTAEIDPNSLENRDDIRQYIRTHLHDDGINRYMRSHNLPGERFVAELDTRSEGNFMYLRHVLPAIASGRLRDRELREIPAGLDGYYADHLKQMSQDSSSWVDYQLPVIVKLATMPRPLTLDQIAKDADVSYKEVMKSARDWGPFLKPERVRFADSKDRTVFSIYHSSFQEYLRLDPYVKDYIVAAEDSQRDYGNERYR